MRAEFQMTEQQLQRLMDACLPAAAMWIGGPPRSVQENANDAWKRLAGELGFVWDTVAPVPGKSPLYFTAEKLPGEVPGEGDERG